MGPRLRDTESYSLNLEPPLVVLNLYLLRRKIAGPDVKQLLLAYRDFDGLVALEYLLEYVAIFLLRGVGHDFLPSPLTDAIDQTRARDLALGDVVLGAKLQKVTSMAY